ncbi:hypothetical protein BDZ97DRAFT_1808283 [Flammula alnicola]|nr:hypothetical protein BDZ97DRAFT_1808283 [Flammula alnicola]
MQTCWLGRIPNSTARSQGSLSAAVSSTIPTISWIRKLFISRFILIHPYCNFIFRFRRFAITPPSIFMLNLIQRHSFVPFVLTAFFRELFGDTILLFRVVVCVYVGRL